MRSVSLARLRSVGLFLGVAFAVSWGYNGVYEMLFATRFSGTTLGRITPHFSAWGPLVAVALVVWLSPARIRDWFGSQLRVRNPLRVYAIAILLPNAVSSAAMVVFAAHGIPLERSASVVNFLLVFVFTFVLLGALEEFGWRGFLQPALQRRTTAATAAVIVGVVWGLWHVPSYLMGYLGDMSFGLFLAHLVPMSAVMAWLYNTSEGLLPVMAFHAAHNAPGNVFSTIGAVPEAVAALYYPTYTALWILVGGAVVAHAGLGLAADMNDGGGTRPNQLDS